MTVERSISDLSNEEKWTLLSQYLDNRYTKRQLGSFYNLKKTQVEAFINHLYRKMKNIIETKALDNLPIEASGVDIKLFKAMRDTDHINEAFLKNLSKEDEMLSDKELLFTTYLHEYGNELRAIRESGLDIGLNKNEVSSYKEACKMRALYLKRKENVRSYLYELRKRSLDVLEEDGKSYIQSHLIQLLEQLSKNTDRSSLTSQLKTIEHLARTMGAFEDKVTVENVSGDDVLDKIIERAKRAQVVEPPLIEG